ncbi:hypothetical protein [Pontibacter cellulosilyticus]|uniref:Uncharacterized protein n=1 Tax=Pontibacter cellulosilyticus TaxID=1720253 RepID=A0A923SNL8_9BACT|nr:hypothetical protein [Pontibacter cellulosilyticus]MBC5993325.1 hypothetical protein [Pontibacter cellulosilyticus]
MKAQTKRIPMVEKEMIPFFRFTHNDVLENTEARKKRLWDLNRASILGNGYRGKVEITFRTAEGELKRVDTTVWAVDDKYMMLKAGCFIPIASIVGVEFF